VPVARSRGIAGGALSQHRLVEADHGVAAPAQAFGQVRSDEAGGAGDDYAFFHISGQSSVASGAGPAWPA